MPQCIDAVAGAGFVLIQQRGTIESGLQLKFHDGNVQIDLFLYYPMINGRFCFTHQRHNRIRYSYPQFKLEPAVFQGMPIMIPANAEQILEFQYGSDWRTPSTYWSYAFSPANAKPDGSLLWRGYFAWRRAKWKLRCLAQATGLLAVPPSRPILPAIQVRGNTLDTGIIFIDGVFDMLHANHVKVLKDAKKLGEYLVVAVVSDNLAETYKRQPVISEKERLLMVRSLECVNEAYIMSGPLDASNMERILEKYQPRAVVYSGKEAPEFYMPADRLGIRVKPAYRQGINTTAIIDAILTASELNS